MIKCYHFVGWLTTRRLQVDTMWCWESDGLQRVSHVRADKVWVDFYRTAQEPIFTSISLFNFDMRCENSLSVSFLRTFPLPPWSEDPLSETESDQMSRRSNAWKTGKLGGCGLSTRSGVSSETLRFERSENEFLGFRRNKQIKRFVALFLHSSSV